jgi:hypothetical protein
LNLRINKSLTLEWLLFGSHAGAVLIILGLSLPVGWRVALSLAVTVSLGMQRRALMASAGTLRIEPDGHCAWTGDRSALRGPITSAAVFPLFVRLVVAADRGRKRTVLVARDAVAPEAYRELRARIVQRRLPARAGQPSP